MTPGSPFQLRFACALAALAFFGLMQAGSARAEDEKKPGFFSKVFGGGKTDEKPAETPKPEEAPKSAPKSKSSSTAKKAPETASKPKSTPKAEEKPKTEEKPKGNVAVEGNVKNEIKPSATNPWHVIDVGGRDYVTFESIRNFYNPLFGFESLKSKGNHLWINSQRLIIKAEVGSKSLLMNNMKFVLSFPVIMARGHAVISRLDLVKLVDPILNPTHIAGAEYFDTVVVDAGHGGHEPGARGVYGYEKDFTLQMAQRLRTALMAKGFKVVLTRATDVFISLGGRVALANQVPNSIFISLHCNYSDGAASGVETWALTPQGAAATISRGGGYNVKGTTGNHQDSANIALASAVHARVTTATRAVDRGIMRAQWSVLTGIKKPGILVETGFITNAAECARVKDPGYQNLIAAAIADAVVNYREALKPAAMTRR